MLEKLLGLTKKREKSPTDVTVTNEQLDEMLKWLGNQDKGKIEYLELLKKWPRFQ